MVNVSAHGNKRIRSRCGIPKKSVNKLAEEAFTCGITHGETTGSLNKYITALYFYNQSANNIRIYRDKVFIFAALRLITVLNLPARYQKSVLNCIKKRGVCVDSTAMERS
jgi:hypothetical protein